MISEKRGSYLWTKKNTFTPLIMKKIIQIISIIIITQALTGCATVTGGLIGAGIGALSGSASTGAAIGAALGSGADLSGADLSNISR
jgi:hypothetical protein